MYQRPDGLYERKITIDGKRVAVRGKSEREVNRKVKDIDAQYSRERRDGRLFEAIAEEWHDDLWPTLQPTTAHGYRASYERALEEWADARIKEIQPIDIDRFMRDFARLGYAQKTVNTQMQIIKQIFAHAVLMGDIDNSPAEYVRIPRGKPGRVRDLPKDEDIQAIITNVGLPMGLYHLFLLCTGCRPGEALAVTGADIDLKHERLRIAKSVYFDDCGRPHIKVPKTAAGERSIFLPPMLSTHIPRGLAPDAYLFAGKSGKLRVKTAYEKALRQYRMSTGVTCTPYQLRHAYATILYEAKVQDKDAQHLMGHTSITVTRDVYTAISKRQMERTAGILRAVFPANADSVRILPASDTDNTIDVL